ncbi:hypothetical protein HKX48_003506 [Thoreauomyces humboldtii]|nr:hypothetical protein HKX48_003506 [Thoreauomyces humboldtii]
MTPVQALSLPIILQGQDCLAQAKTGTGKTIAFLVPSIELLRRRGVTTGVNILIISPTRELAFQIGEEAKTLVKFDQGRIGVQMVVGGTPVNKDVRALQSQPCQILVGTPGRLLDLLQNYNLKAGCSKLKVLILDEADRLLEQGFRQDIERILTYLPQKTSVPRQTLLFSATIPAGVKEIASLALSKDFKFISTVNKSDVDTHQHVAQFLIQAPLANSQAATFSLLQALNAQGKSKVVVFLPTARATQLAYECFQAMRKDFLPLPSWELHSRKSQSARTKTSDAFKDAPRGVLFSSDVSARGMDFPDVAAVVQCGVPQNREQYVHRLGRTARAGKEGEGYLILAPFEEFFVNKLKGMDVQTVTLDNVLAVQPYVDDAYTRVDDLTKNQTYSAWIGYYKGWLKDMRWTSTMLVQAANAFAENIGCRGIPEIPAQTVGKMGLKGVPGLNVVKGIQKGRGGR